MTTTAYPSNLTWIGIGKETVYGTAVAAPDTWIPVSSPKFTPGQNMIADQASRGLMGTDYQQIAGMRNDMLAYTCDVYLDSVFQHLLAILGYADTVTGSADPYTHTTALYNGDGSDAAQPPSYTGFYFDASGTCWQIPGMILDSLKIDVKVDEAVSMDAEWTGLKAIKMSAAPTNTPSTDVPMPSWNGIIDLAGSANDTFEEVAITFKREVKPVQTIANSQTPSSIYGGAVTVSGDLTSVYQSSDVNLADYLANTQPALSVKIAPAGDTTHYLEIQHSTVGYQKVEVNPGTDWVEAASTLVMLMNATDALDSKQSPAKVTFLTSASTAY